MEKLATTLSLAPAAVCAAAAVCATQVAPIRAPHPAAANSRRESIFVLLQPGERRSRFEVASRKKLAHETADATKQERGEIEGAGNENDRGTGRDTGVEREQEPG